MDLLISLNTTILVLAIKNLLLLLMEEILHHLGVLNYCISWGF